MTVDPDILARAEGLDLDDAEDRATFRQRIDWLYRHANRRLVNPRKIADEAIEHLRYTRKDKS